MGNLEDLREAWRTSPHPSVKVESYFPVYADLFGHLRGTACTFVETGILDGGSLFMWRKWLGPKARIIGIDLNPQVMRWCEDGFEVFVGDQGDPAFWSKTFRKIGSFDVLLDDGGHQSFQQIVTTLEAVHATQHQSMIVIEDTACSFMKDFSRHGSNHFINFAKDATDLLTARFAKTYEDRMTLNAHTRAADVFANMYAIRFYAGMVVFELNKDKVFPAKVIRNRESQETTDFRYQGRTSAKVEWPSAFRSHQRRIRGGEGFWSPLLRRLKARLTAKTT